MHSKLARINRLVLNRQIFPSFVLTAKQIFSIWSANKIYRSALNAPTTGKKEIITLFYTKLIKNCYFLRAQNAQLKHYYTTWLQAVDFLLLLVKNIIRVFVFTSLKILNLTDILTQTDSFFIRLLLYLMMGENKRIYLLTWWKLLISITYNSFSFISLDMELNIWVNTNTLWHNLWLQPVSHNIAFLFLNYNSSMN